MATITDITFDEKGRLRMPQDELAQFASLDISVSDTETTGLNRDRCGLTEIASVRGMMEDDGPRLKLFHSFVLPLKPAYRDYLRLREEAKQQGREPPPYDRRLYEYEVTPAALAVTGTEILRKRMDGPITGLKVGGKRVDARPFYEVMDDFLAFTRNGENDVYYNAPFDRPFLGNQIRDVRAHQLAQADVHRDPGLQSDARLSGNAKKLFLDPAYGPYAILTSSQQREIRIALAPLAAVPPTFTNPALYQCLYYGFLAHSGFGPSNTLDDATRKVVDASYGGRSDHSGIEDVVLAARVALRQAAPDIADMRGVYEQVFRRIDPQGRAELLPARKHSNGKEQVEGDIALRFSRPPEELGEDAVRFWHFLAAFKEAPRINSRVPKHVLSLDENSHTAVINAERKQPLSLNFLKKCIFFGQMLHSPVLYSMLPYDSTGNFIDVVLREMDPETGKRRVVEDVHYGSLRANVAFLEAHPEDAGAYLQLISRLRKADRAVGMVLLRERDNGAVDVIVKGHLRAFGECVMRIPPGLSVKDAIGPITNELQTLIKLGVIPQVGHFGGVEEAMEDDGEEPDALSTNPREDRLEDQTSSSRVASRVEQDGQTMSLTLSDLAFHCISHRLGRAPEEVLRAGRIVTANGPISLTRQEDGTILLRGAFDAFYDFVETDKEGEVAEKPSNLIRDASWLLYRLERIPGTYGLRMEGDMAVLDQRGGVDVEALGLLYHLGIPFKAYDTSIKLDAKQLMKNAFHWSLALSRAQKSRKEVQDGISEGITPPRKENRYYEPQRFLLSIQEALLSGKAQALEMNERRDIWLLDPAASPEEQPSHHALKKPANSLNLVFKGKRLAPELSDTKGPQELQIIVSRDGSSIAQASPLLLTLASARLSRKQIDGASLAMKGSSDVWHIPKEKKQAVLSALYEASRFMDQLSKQTGSERLCVQHAELDDNERVRFRLPHLRFLGNGLVHDEALDIHKALSSSVSDRHIHSLQRGLPSPRQADRRHGDVMLMTASCLEQVGEIDGLTTELNSYLRLLGAAEHENDPAAPMFADALRGDLATLGMMLHELAATPNKSETKPAVWNAIQIAQEKLSAATFGFDQLREDLAVARKALNGGVSGDGGLRREIGCAMGTLMLDAAVDVARYDPDAFSAQSMATYKSKMHGLLSAATDHAAIYSYYARHAALRYMLDLPKAEDPPALQETLAHYFLHEAFPSLNEPQRTSLVALYREGRNAGTEEEVRRQFTATSKKGDTPGADHFLRQHHLLTHPKEAELTFDSWLHQHPQPEIEAQIDAAYQRRGKLYLEMAYLLNPHRDDWQAQHDAYIERAKDCLLRAGWTEEKFETVNARTAKRSMSDARKEHVRAQMELNPDPAEARLEDMVATIDLGDHEDQVRQNRQARAYRAYQNDTMRMVEDVPDPYYMHKQRMGLLGHIEKTLKETHDLLMVKFHYVRDLQGMLVLLQQDPAISASSQQSDVSSIGAPIRPIPELAGIHDDTLKQIQQSIEGMQHELSSHLRAYLHDGHIAATVESDGDVTCDLRGLQQLFNTWCKEKKPDPARAPLPEHLYPWLERATLRLFRCPTVQRIVLDKSQRHIECVVHLPVGEQERAQAWAQLRLAAVGLGLNLPAMPQSSGEVHTLRLPFLSRVQRNQTPFNSPAKDHDLREVLGAFAVKEGMPAPMEKSFVSGIMRQRAQSSQPLLDALANIINAGGDPAEIHDILHRSRQR